MRPSVPNSRPVRGAARSSLRSSTANGSPTPRGSGPGPGPCFGETGTGGGDPAPRRKVREFQEVRDIRPGAGYLVGRTSRGSRFQFVHAAPPPRRRAVVPGPADTPVRPLPLAPGQRNPGRPPGGRRRTGGTDRGRFSSGAVGWRESRITSVPAASAEGVSNWVVGCRVGGEVGGRVGDGPLSLAGVGGGVQVAVGTDATPSGGVPFVLPF